MIILSFYILIAAVAGIAASAVIGFVFTNLMIGHPKLPIQVSHEQGFVVSETKIGKQS
jgi:hypothetical protein